MTFPFPFMPPTGLVFRDGYNTPTTNSSSTDYQGRMVRVRFPPSTILAGPSSHLRIFFRPRGSDVLSFSGVFVGLRATSGDPYDMDPTTITQVLFNDGSPTVTFASNSGGGWSDPVAFALNGTRDLMVSMGYAPTYQRGRFNYDSAVACYFFNSQHLNAGVANVSGASTDYGSVQIDKIEVA